MLKLFPKVVMPTRFVIAIMIFSACFVNYMLRVNMSINLIAMVEPPNKPNSTRQIPECVALATTALNLTANQEQLTSLPDHGTRFDWDTKLQALILGSYFWGFTITCIPGGLLAENFGPTRVVLISSLISGALTILSPLMATWHYGALITSRFLVGLCGGVIYPSLHCLVSKWAPPEEKGKFVGALLGGTLGTVVTWPLLGAIIENWGWSWSFYINGIVVLLWCIIWTMFVSDSPDVHRRISEEEKLYISKCLGDVIKKHTALPPYSKIAVSVPFWALAVLHYGNLWGLFFLMTAGPNFLSTVLGFNLGHTGILASMPHLARLILGVIFGTIGDLIRKRQLLSTTVVRKSFIVFSHFLPGVLLLCMNMIGCDYAWSIGLLTLSLGSNGASTLTNLQNSQDLAPNFAGSLYGIINCIGSTTGFVTPMIVGLLTEAHNGLHEWHIIFGIGAIVYIVSGVVFCIFGSAAVQPWNEIDDNTKEGIDNPAFTTTTTTNNNNNNNSNNNNNNSNSNNNSSVKDADLQVENTKC